MITDISSIISLAMIGLLGLIVGILVGFLLSGLRNANQSRKPKHGRDLVEVMRIWRDRRSGQLSIEIGEKVFKKVDDLNEKLRAGLIKFLDELYTWIGVPSLAQRMSEITSVPPPVLEYKPSTLIPEEPSKNQRPVAPTVTPQPSADMDTVRVTTPPSPDLTRPTSGMATPKMEMADALSRTTAPDLPKETPQVSKSIAAQVDEIIQEKLASSPLKDRVIRILELPHKGMVVLVDSDQYEGVNDVPDLEVRQLLRESVVEWERRMGP